MKPLTLDELAAEMKQGRQPPPEAWAKAREYERSLFPADTRWPQTGERYECIENCPTHFFTHWHVPFTGGGEGSIIKGDLLRIENLDEPQPLFVPAVPLDYALVQRRVVPATDINHPNYAGFSFSVRMRDLVAKFRRVD